MRRSSVRLLVSSLSALALVALAGGAAADEKKAAEQKPSTGKTTTTAARVDDSELNATKPAPDKVEKKDDDETRFRPLALTLNPLSLALTRLGINVEYLPAKHHGIMLNPYGQFVSAEGGGSKTSYTNLGAELGYHFYTGSKGANGFFVGPSVLYMHSSTETTALNTKVTGDFSAYGAAVDLGGQHVFDNGITLGGGVGLMYLKSSATAGATSSTVKFDGVLPRFLFMAGYSI